MKTYDELLDTWEENVPSFLEWIYQACGVEQESDLDKIIKKNIVSDEDLETWIRFFDGNLDNIAETTEAYICHKEAYSV